MIDLTKTIEMEKHNNKKELGFNSFDCFDCCRRNISKHFVVMSFLWETEPLAFVTTRRGDIGPSED